MNITYAKATADDIAPIYGLCRQLIDDYENLESIDYPRVLNWIQKKIEESIGEYTVIFADEQKAGYYHFFRNEEGVFEIDDLYVFPEFQNQGIGTGVLRKCCASVSGPVMLYVFVKNTRAVSLYKRLGFENAETRNGSRYIMRNENRKYYAAYEERQEAGITSALPDFNSLMFAVVKKK